MVFEAEMEFAPGPYELTSVAHDLKRDTVVSGRVEGEWPDPRDHDATVGPIALVQPADAVFVRDGEHRTRGSMARADGERIRADLPAALLAIVCVDRGKQDSFEVERRLEGESVAGFPPLAVPPDKERCFLFSDLVRAGTMTEGQFQYAVRVLHDDEELARGARAFIAVAPQPVAAESPPTDM